VNLEEGVRGFAPTSLFRGRLLQCGAVLALCIYTLAITGDELMCCSGMSPKYQARTQSSGMSQKFALLIMNNCTQS